MRGSNNDDHCSHGLVLSSTLFQVPHSQYFTMKLCSHIVITMKLWDRHYYYPPFYRWEHWGTGRWNTLPKTCRKEAVVLRCRPRWSGPTLPRVHVPHRYCDEHGHESSSKSQECSAKVVNLCLSWQNPTSMYFEAQMISPIPMLFCHVTWLSPPKNGVCFPTSLQSVNSGYFDQ